MYMEMISWQFCWTVSWFPIFYLHVDSEEDEFGITYATMCIGPFQTRWRGSCNMINKDHEDYGEYFGQ